MRGLLFGFLFVVALVYGASHASALLYWAMGPWSAVGFEQDGGQSHFQFGQNLPRPDWVPVYPGATVVNGSRVVAARAPSGFHSLEIATRASLDEVKRFYTGELAATGFEVADLGIAPLNPATAAYLGIAGRWRANVPRATTRSPSRSAPPIPSRLLQIHWYKISEHPQHAAAVPKS